MHDLTDCDNNRFGIRPFPRVATYPTRSPVNADSGKFVRTANSVLWLKTGVSKPIAILRRFYAAAEAKATLSG